MSNVGFQYTITLFLVYSLGKYRSMVGDKVEEAKWKGLCVNDHWQQMNGIMMECAQDICGMTEEPCAAKRR